jgi:hypothetical protein
VCRPPDRKALFRDRAFDPKLTAVTGPIASIRPRVRCKLTAMWKARRCGSALFAQASTASSDGAVNAMHDSFMPLSGAILLGNMMVDEVIFGAPGSGLWGVLLFCLVAVFLAGLMIGRTPEFVGKKIEQREMKMTMLALLVAPAVILGLTAAACALPAGRRSAMPGRTVFPKSSMPIPRRRRPTAARSPG